MSNTYVVEGDVAHIMASQGKVIKVDAADIEAVKQHHWRVDKDPLGKFYARARSKEFKAFLHNYLLNPPEGMMVEHINGDKLDCRRENMRVVTAAQRAHTRKRSSDHIAASGVENVAVSKRKDGRVYYFASVMRNGIKKSKTFPYTPEGLEAAKNLVSLWLEDITYEPERPTIKRKRRDISYVTPEPEVKTYYVRPVEEEFSAGTWRNVGVDFYLTIKPGIEAIVSPQDYRRVVLHSWNLSPNGFGSYYAKTAIDGKTVYMHRLIMKAPKGFYVDHLNHDTLDNRRSNLVIKTSEHNNANRDGAYVNSKTGIRGLSVHKCKPSGLMYVYRCHCLSCKVAKYFEYSEAGFEDAKKFANEHNEIRDRITNNPYF